MSGSSVRVSPRLSTGAPQYRRRGRRPPWSFGLRMLVWGLFLMNVGLLITLQVWLEGGGRGVSYAVAVSPILVGVVIVARAARWFNDDVEDEQHPDSPR